MQFCSAGAQRRSLALRPLEFSKPATARLPPVAATPCSVEAPWNPTRGFGPFRAKTCHSTDGPGAVIPVLSQAAGQQGALVSAIQPALR